MLYETEKGKDGSCQPLKLGILLSAHQVGLARQCKNSVASMNANPACDPRARPDPRVRCESAGEN